MAFRLLSFGDRIPCGDYALHSRFDKAANLTSGGGLVALVRPEVGAGPLNIVLRGFTPRACPRKLTVEPDGFILGGRVLPKSSGELYRSFADLGGTDPDHFASNLDVLREELTRQAPPGGAAVLLDPGAVRVRSRFDRELAAGMRAGARELNEGDPAKGARRLRGLGRGLTPAGDDVLAGFLAGCSVVEGLFNRDMGRIKRAVFTNARGRNLISNAFLVCAREGRLFERLKRLVEACALSSEQNVAARVKDVVRVGGTSGADIATGFLLAAERFCLVEACHGG